MNVCGYVRVSSDGQMENYSIPQQQKAIFEDAKLHLNDNFDTEQKRAILHSLIKKIVLKDDEIQIYWRFE